MDFDPAMLAQLLGSQPPGPGDQALALQRQFGMLGQLSGDKVLAPFGKGLEDNALQQQQQQLAQQKAAASLGMQQAQIQRQTANDDAMRRYHEAMTANAQRNTDLKSNEVGATTDVYGNPTYYAKHNAGGPLVSPRTVGGGGGGAGGAGMLTPEAKAMLAQQLRTTGVIPQVGRGKAGPAIVASIVNEAARGEPVNLAENKAAYKADTTSLGKQQVLLDLTSSWENTGKANLGVLRGISQQLANAGSPLLNRPLRWAYQNMAGDPVVSKFKAAHAAVVNEYAKILSGSTGGGGVTEGARHEAEQMLPLDATPAQIAAAADLLETDAGNRLSALKQQLGVTRARVSGKAPPEEKPARASSPELSQQDQEAISWAKANPKDPRAAKILSLHGVQ